MRVLVLGGTGAMGVHLVELLSKAEIQVVVTSRSHKNSEGNIRYIRGNAHDAQFLQEILREKWDVIIDFMVYATSSFEDRINFLLDATSQYVFLSSARVYAESKQPITENSPRLLDASHDKEFLATDEYSLAKARQENILIKSKYKNWTIVRPYITYSQYRLQLGVLEKEAWLYRVLHGRTIVFSADIASKLTTLTHGLDVARGMMTLIGNPKALGEVFHITASNSVYWKDVLVIYLEVLERYLGYKPKVLLKDLKNFSNCHPAKYQIIYDRLFDRQFDNSKIGQFIDVNGFEKIETELKRNLENFLLKPEFGNIDWKAEALKDRQTKESVLFGEIKGVKQKIRYFLYRYLIGK